ncbi:MULTISPECIES: carbonic anhydrase [Dyella]|uniref:carbonic anhydrase n=2 Tax=Dyella TaxID=231454 RepID=A0A4V2NMF2_9GAMM|nr:MULTISPECIES: carbonic anhydrase family protein [Dyella]TBR39365.1 carbonic anhydrase family protein [Dyella terrae]TCI13047.1 carbonic anhydrase family protein [Dyella soli]
MQKSKRHVTGLTALAVAAASVGALALPQASGTGEPSHHWTYAGESGPTHWSALDAAFAACHDGRAQSPIDLESKKAKPGAPGHFHIDYEKSDVGLVNNGHTIQANVSSAGDTMKFDGDTYKLAQFHFHSPSEHTENGTRFPLEIHFVHADAHKRVAVLGVLVKLGKENESLAPVFRSLPAHSENAPTPGGATIPVNLASILPADHEAFVYSGSLTTPPCSEDVRWIVLTHPIQMSGSQIASFKKLFPDNHRPLQKVNGREVDEESE